jgi:hypothetical protein
MDAYLDKPVHEDALLALLDRCGARDARVGEH